MNDKDWKRLLDQMRDGFVVPVLGPQLLIGPDGRSLQEQVARQVLAAHDVNEEVVLPPFHELNAAVSWLRTHGTITDQTIHEDVHDAICALPGVDSPQFPSAIRKLAEISDFRLFVTLTPDGLLAQSLRSRCAVSEIIHSPGCKPPVLPTDWRDRPGEVYVLYLFGKSLSVPMCAIHEEDILEYAHDIIASHSLVPNQFLNELEKLNLLLIGCNFPDWLSRFVLRLLRNVRLSGQKSRREWLVEELKAEDTLTCFLRSYSTETEVLSQLPPLQFVEELHSRWLAARGGSAAGTPSPGNSTPRPSTLFFISYSRKTDLPQAEKFFNFLIGLGVSENEIWFDRQTIDPGQDFGNRILEGIEGCRYFLPLVSVEAVSREEAFVFREWKKANFRNEAINRDFLIPVIIDPEFEPDRYTSDVVKPWKTIHFGHAPEGLPDDRLSTKLKAMLAEIRNGAPKL